MSNDKEIKIVVIGESSGASREEIMRVYPKHKLIVDGYVYRGEIIGIGPFSNGGNMAIFKTRMAAEQFIIEDPFVLEGIVKSYIILEWGDKML